MFGSELIKGAISGLIGPFFDTALKGWQAKLASDNNVDKHAAELAGRSLELDQREAELNTDYKKSILGRWYEPINILGYVIVAYVTKVVVWDTMLGLGSTLPIKGDVGQWMGMYMVFLLGKRGVENTASIIGNVIKNVWRRGK